MARIELAIEPWEGSLLPLQHTRVDVILTGGGLHLCPAELLGGAALMAISASNVTFLYFSERFVSTALSAEEGNGLQFVDAVSVVEIQYQRVAFAAVDAGMGAQVFIYLPVEILSIAPLTFPVGRGVPGFVPSVVRLRVFAHARPTASSAQSPTAVAIGKVLGRFCFPAAGTLAKSKLLAQ